MAAADNQALATVVIAINKLECKEEGAPDDLATSARWSRRMTPLLSIDLVKIKSKLATIILNLITVHSSH